MFAYPQRAAFNRILPKNMIYKNAQPSNAVKKRFVSEVSEIVWQYKLSKDTVNLAPKDGVMEIQVFKITLKAPELSKDILKVIDKAIPYPIFYRIQFEDCINRVAAYKRVNGNGYKRENGDNTGNCVNCVIGDYYETGWTEAKAPEIPLPVALNLKSLYEQMMVFYIGLPLRADETLDEVVERAQLIRQKQRELQALEIKMSREKQFNRKVEINSQIRALRNELEELHI
jgi:hypothetical protein